MTSAPPPELACVEAERDVNPNTLTRTTTSRASEGIADGSPAMSQGHRPSAQVSCTAPNATSAQSPHWATRRDSDARLRFGRFWADALGTIFRESTLGGPPPTPDRPCLTEDVRRRQRTSPESVPWAARAQCLERCSNKQDAQPKRSGELVIWRCHHHRQHAPASDPTGDPRAPPTPKRSKDGGLFGVRRPARPWPSLAEPSRGNASAWRRAAPGGVCACVCDPPEAFSPAGIVPSLDVPAPREMSQAKPEETRTASRVQCRNPRTASNNDALCGQWAVLKITFATVFPWPALLIAQRILGLW